MTSKPSKDLKKGLEIFEPVQSNSILNYSGPMCTLTIDNLDVHHEQSFDVEVDEINYTI
uniref:Uncharacterized protein n=1 Tax=Oryza sativa subsp. japonica TaxID=39947 RepID=Q69M35_ORYSJ|nr:hypothetical protein [Oryza sativa Japonica Group]BAD36380.1 hypothetical protein [Oryza sativa Japonica Group]